MDEFQQLVEAHYQALYRFAYSLAKNADGASDLVQQTYCRWAEKGHQLKDRSKAKTWLFTTLYREFLATKRKQERYSSEDIDEIEYKLPSHSDASDRQIDAKRAVRKLMELDELFRAPLSLFYLQQHSYKEIAKILDIPIGTVMSRISRGKTQLKKNMSETSSSDKIISIKPEARQKNHG